MARWARFTVTMIREASISVESYPMLWRKVRGGETKQEMTSKDKEEREARGDERNKEMEGHLLVDVTSAVK